MWTKLIVFYVCLFELLAFDSSGELSKCLFGFFRHPFEFSLQEEDGNGIHLHEIQIIKNEHIF